MVGIYKITSPTGKVYIGQSLNIYNRFSYYKSMCKSMAKQRKLFTSLQKHGWDNHKVEIIHELPIDVERETLNVYEKLYMECYIDCGIELLNIKEGGSNGRHSEETKEKLRTKGRFGMEVTEETRAKMRVAASRPRPHRIGMKFSEEGTIKRQIAQRNKKKPVFTEAGKATLRESAKRMVEKRVYTKHPRLGKLHSEATKLKMSLVKKGMPNNQNKKVVCFKTGIMFNSIKEAAESISMQAGTLRMQLRGKNTNRTSFNFITNKT